MKTDLSQIPGISLRIGLVPRDFRWLLFGVAGLVVVVFTAAWLVGFNSNIVLFALLLGVNMYVAFRNFNYGMGLFLVLSFINGYLNRVTFAFSDIGFSFLYAYPQFALAGLSAIALLNHFSEHQGKFRLRLLDKLILLFLAWSLLQALNPTQSVVVSLYGIRFRFVPVLLYFLVRVYIKSLADLLQFHKLLLTLTIITAAYGIYQNVVGLPDIEFAWIEAFPSILAQKTATLGGGQGGWYNDGQLRVFSTFSGGNEFYYVMVFLALFILGFNPLPRRFSWQAWRWLAVILFFVMLFVTRERTPLGMFLVGSVVLAIFRFRPALVRPAILAGLMAVLVMLAVFVQLNREYVIHALGGDLAAIRLVELANPFQANTVAWRMQEVWMPSVELIASNPLGYGLGSTRYSRATRDGDLVIAPHNTYLEVGVELGVIGLSLFLLIILESVRLALAIKHRYAGDRRLYFLPDAILAVLAAALACAVISTVLLDTAGLLIWLMLGLLHVASVLKHQTSVAL